MSNPAADTTKSSNNTSGCNLLGPQLARIPDLGAQSFTGFTVRQKFVFGKITEFRSQFSRSINRPQNNSLTTRRLLFVFCLKTKFELIQLWKTTAPNAFLGLDWKSRTVQLSQRTSSKHFIRTSRQMPSWSGPFCRIPAVGSMWLGHKVVNSM